MNRVREPRNRSLSLSAAVFSGWDGVLLGLVVLLVLIPVGRGFGPYWDTWFYHDHALRWSGWFSSWWDASVESPSVIEDPRYFFPDEKRHPPLLEVGGGLFHALFGRFLGEVSAARLFVEMFAAVWSAAAFLFLKKRIGRGLAFAGAALFWGSPRFVLHSVLYAIDGLIASVYWLAILSFLAWEKGPRGKLLVYGFLVIALLTKLQAFFLFPILLLWRTYVVLSNPTASRSERRKRLSTELAQFGGVLLLSLATWFLLWPALWLDFPKGLINYVEFITRHSNVPVLYFGKLYKGETTPPWHYPWVFSGIALPLFSTLPAVVRLVRSVIRRLRQEQDGSGSEDLLLWLGFAFPLLSSSLPQAPKYDGIRLLLPAYGPLCLLSAQELGEWWKFLQLRWFQSISPLLRNLVLCGIGVLMLLPAVRFYPFNIVYYSPLIGGVRGAREKGFDLDYLGIALNRLNPGICEHAGRGDILLLAGCNALVGKETGDGWIPIPKGVYAVDFKLIRRIKFQGRRVFAVISSRYNDLTPDALEVLRQVPPLDAVYFQGERLFSLHLITRDFVLSLPEGSESTAGVSPETTGASHPERRPDRSETFARPESEP